jgi:hypothetical protein
VSQRLKVTEESNRHDVWDTSYTITNYKLQVKGARISSIFHFIRAGARSPSSIDMSLGGMWVCLCFTPPFRLEELQ